MALLASLYVYTAYLLSTLIGFTDLKHYDNYNRKIKSFRGNTAAMLSLGDIALLLQVLHPGQFKYLFLFFYYF